MDLYQWLIFFSIEIVGRFPEEAEAEKFNIRTDIPIWLPTDVTSIPWFNQFIPALKAQWPVDA